MDTLHKGDNDDEDDNNNTLIIGLEIYSLGSRAERILLGTLYCIQRGVQCLLVDELLSQYAV